MAEAQTGTHGYAVRWNGERQVLVHREVMEGLLGRELERHENVHHRNGDKLDNRPENLELIDHAAHVSLHHYGVPKKPETRARIVSLRAEGLTQSQIAETVGLDQSTVCRHLQAAAGNPRPDWRKVGSSYR